MGFARRLSLNRTETGFDSPFAEPRREPEHAKRTSGFRGCPTVF